MARHPNDVLDRDKRDPAVGSASPAPGRWRRLLAHVVFKPLEPFFGFEQSIVFQRIPAWNELVNGPADEKLATLADPAWRARARHEWDHRPHVATARVDRPHSLSSPCRHRRRSARYLVGGVRRPTGLHVSDALAEWLSGNGIGSSLVGTPDELDEDEVVELLRDPHTLSNVNDSGRPPPAVLRGGPECLHPHPLRA